MPQHNKRLIAIGTRIREKMGAEGHTISALAARSEVSKSTLGRILKGEVSTIDVAAHERIAGALGLSFSDLIAVEKPLFPKLLGIEAIDQLLWTFYGALYQGDRGLKIAKTVTYEGYRLYYLQHALQELKMDLTNAPNTKSNTKALTLDQEFEANALIAKRGNIAVEPQEAWVTGKQSTEIICYTRTLTTKPDDSVHHVPNHLELHQLNTVDVIALDTPWERILQGTIPKIRKRSIGLVQAVHKVS